MDGIMGLPSPPDSHNPLHTLICFQPSYGHYPRDRWPVYPHSIRSHGGEGGLRILCSMCRTISNH